MIYHKKALLAALGTIVLWAFAFPASKAMLVWFSAEQMVLLRYIVACGFYALLFGMGIFPRPKLRDLPALVVLGLLGITIYQLFFVKALAHISAGAAAMLVTTNPIFVALLAQIFFAEKLSKLAWLGIALSLLGVTLVTLGDNTGGQVKGYLFMLLAVFAIAVYFVFQKPLFARYSPLALTSYTSLGGTLPLLYLLPQSLQAAAAAPASALWVVAAMGVLSSGVGFLLWFYALSKLPAGVVSSALFLQPVFVSIIAWWWLGEIPPLLAFIGGAVTLVGVALVLLPPNDTIWRTTRKT